MLRAKNAITCIVLSACDAYVRYVGYAVSVIL